MPLQPLCEQAIRLHQAGKLTEAELLYRRLLDADPSSFTPRHLLGIVRAQQGRNEEAIALIDAALKIDPGAAPAWLNHGNILATMGRNEQALASYNRALGIRPGDVETLHNRGRTLLDMGRFAEALADYDQVLAFKPRELSVLKDRGSILWHLGRSAEAQASLAKALSIRPGDVETLNNLGNILRDRRQFQAALKLYDQALAIDSNLAETRNNRGVALAELHRHAEALASFDAALALRPDMAEAWNNRGDAQRALGDCDAALASIARALALLPDYPAALNNRAKTLCEKDRIADGFADFRRAAELVYGTAPVAADATPVRQRHDAQQRAYLAAQGKSVGDALYLSGGARLPRAINPAIASTAWRESMPRLAVVDDLLTPEALTQLRRFCHGSTVWRRAYGDGYVGAFPETGFACPLLAQIAEELRDILSDIFTGHPLRYLWAFRYDGTGRGTHIHADEAAVNVNFWLAPDDANLDPASGGLAVWDKSAPADWDFGRFNNDIRAAEDFLAASGARPRVIPHRANRAVIFDSNLFHRTDDFVFREGYENQRLNVTLLYGRRLPP